MFASGILLTSLPSRQPPRLYCRLLHITKRWKASFYALFGYTVESSRPSVYFMGISLFWHHMTFAWTYQSVITNPFLVFRHYIIYQGFISFLSLVIVARQYSNIVYYPQQRSLSLRKDAAIVDEERQIFLRQFSAFHNDREPRVSSATPYHNILSPLEFFIPRLCIAA